MRSGTALTPTGPNADDRKRQHVAAMLSGRIRLTITWQCDMIGIQAVRHSDTEPVGQTNHPIFSEREHDSLYVVVRPSVVCLSATFVHPYSGD